MTTQDTHHEQNDVDASVVEHPSTPEHTATASSTPSEVSAPAARIGEEGNPSPELTSSAEKQAVVNQEASTSTEARVVEPAVSAQLLAQESPVAAEDTVASIEVQETSHVPAVALEVAETKQDASTSEVATSASTHEATGASPAEPAATAHPAESELQTHQSQQTHGAPAEQTLPGEQQQPTDVPFAAAETAVSGELVIADSAATEQEKTQPVEELASPMNEGYENLLTAQVPPLIDPKAEEVRPFTDFIAEFRQAEEALRDSQVEALSILSSAAADLAFVEPQAEEITVLEDAKNNEAVVIVGKEDGVQVTTDEANMRVSSAQDVAEATDIVEKQIPAQPTIRPVSPLLRPASRLRIPRHGVTRHQREEANSENQALSQAKPESRESQSTRAEVTAQQPGTTGTDSAAQPRPARRYRFDRPATLNNGANGSSPAASVPAALDSAPSQVVNNAAAPSRVEETQGAYTAKVETAQQPAEQTPEPQVAKEIEPAIPAPDHSRRRHNSHKEPVVTAQATQVIPPVVEPVVQVPEPVAQEVAPEDLPPLEYSELQKASSRRRRRHRSTTSSVPAVPPVTSIQNGVNALPSIPVVPVIPTVPVVPPTVAPTAPVLPTAPAARVPASEPNQSAYTIVSGYTVNQMNQGNDLSGPFMGPDPSPARGSVMTRDGRTVRAETRTTQPTAPIYPPSRSAESGMSTAAMTQFANIVSQALQTQTDRMVSEFRRISQAPTNVSVTLPPFPSTERVGVFVDVANLLYSARTLRMGVDFGKLLDFLRGNRRLVRAHAYCPTSPQPSDEQMFLQAVKGLGYRITTKNYKTFSSGAKKADLDLDLCMDVVRLVDGSAVDCVVLVSGDSDFMPMLDYCSDHGVRVEVAAFDEAMSATLRQSCDLFINLSMLEEIRA
ncbi:MAG: hypothetical protein NVS4B9_20970 [Ktedonobacteraceae bacterium]